MKILKSELFRLHILASLLGHSLLRLSLSLPFSRSLSRALSLALSLSRARSLSLSRALSLPLCLSFPLSPPLSIPLSLPLSLPLSRSLALSLSRSLALSLSLSRAFSLAGGGGHGKGVKELEGNGVAKVLNEDGNSSVENVLKEKLQQQQVLVEQLQHRYSNNKNSRKSVNSDFA